MIKKIDAVLEVEFLTEQHAKTAKESLDPDNELPPPMEIITRVQGRMLQINVQNAPSFGSLENTLVEFVDQLQMQVNLEKMLKTGDDGVKS